MKKSAAVMFFAATLLFFVAAEAGAQSRFGVIGGMTFSQSDARTLNRSTLNKYHAGLTYQLKLPLGFSIQPSLIYNVKGSKMKDVTTDKVNNTFDVSVGYLELPVSVQWGPDLLLFRPFLDVTPYVGVGVNNVLYYNAEGEGMQSVKNSWKGANISRLEYGLGVGVGLEIWKFQVIGRYNWNLGSLADLKSAAEAETVFPVIVENVFGDGKHFNGITLSVSFMF